MTAAGRIVLLALILFFIPAFSDRVVPSHDALQVYTAYWTYISGLITEGRLPEWIPYSRYGTPAGPVFMYVTPVAYVTGALGAIAHKSRGPFDTLFLFKITVALEYLLFAAGVLRLGTLLYTSQWTRAVVAVLAIFSSPWILSLDGNFHAFYLTPWILAELTLALQTARPRHLGYAALIAVFSCVGNVPYYPPFLLLQLFVFSLPLLWAWRANLKALLLNGEAALWMTLAIAMAGIHFGALIKGMQGLAIFSAGRDPVTNRVPLGVFLTYAGNTRPVQLLFELLQGRCTNGDNTFYMGLATLGLFPLSFLARPTPLLRALQTLAIFILLFSTGGIVASAAYYFPGMAFYRHVAIVFGLFRLLAFLCAGYLLDQFLMKADPFSDWRARVSSAAKHSLLWIAVFVAAVDLLRGQLFGEDLRLVLMYYIPEFDVAYLRLFAYLAVLFLAGRPRTRRLWPALLMGALVFDLMSFWAAGWLRWPRLNEAQAATMARLTPARTLSDPGARFTEAEARTRAPLFRFVSTTEPLHLLTSAIYVHTYFWTGEDPCVPKGRTDFLSMPVARFFSARGIPFTPDIGTERRLLQDPLMVRALACGQPRIESTAQVRTFARGYDWLQMTVENAQSRPVPLAISEGLHDGWRVSIDGAPARLSPAHDAFLGVLLPPGRHDVLFRFHLPVAGPLRTVEALLCGISAVLFLALAVRVLVTNSKKDAFA
ncbi:MAG TPA: hypothetical protein VHW00_24695 [Thermoanaerobaculia bacterium]|nr:hypothetical protein [Thermoanaerobaculia bacterium]